MLIAWNSLIKCHSNLSVTVFFFLFCFCCFFPLLSIYGAVIDKVGSL